MAVKIALPKGKLLSKTAETVEKAGWGIEGYTSKARLYRLESSADKDLSAKIMHEKDIPIQVAVGNYDIGICGLDWFTEHTVKYPKSKVVKVKELGYGKISIFAAVDPESGFENIKDLRSFEGAVRLAGEYPNIAEDMAEKMRLRNFSIYPLWGAAEAYPPENAEVAIMARGSEAEVGQSGLKTFCKVLDSNACLVVNKESLEKKDLSGLINSFVESLEVDAEEEGGKICGEAVKREAVDMSKYVLKVALPDGHQQPHVRKLLDAAGIEMDDYPSETGNRRPKSDTFKDVFFKLTRPQDMAMQVANGNYDIAITGRDWLTDHLYQFPSSPVEELLDLKYGWVRIVAVVNNDVPVENAADLTKYFAGKNVRIATEYTNITDHYARERHFGNYRVMPTWGTTEAFIPDDADMMVENTETGGTIRRHNLKIVDTIFESTACVIGNKNSTEDTVKGERVKEIIERLEKALKEEK